MCHNIESKGHQNSKGKVFAQGPYQSRFSYNDYHNEFCDLVFNELTKLLKRLKSDCNDRDADAQTAFNIHRDVVLQTFYLSLGGAHQFLSHSACFCCLVSPPEHVLPCGHVLCSHCLSAHATNFKGTILELSSCPLEGKVSEWSSPWQISLHPSSAGVRILTLDG